LDSLARRRSEPAQNGAAPAHNGSQLRQTQSLPNLSELAGTQAQTNDPEAFISIHKSLSVAEHSLALAERLPNTDPKQLAALQTGLAHLHQGLLDPNKRNDPAHLAGAKTLSAGLADAAQHLAKTTPISVHLANGGRASLFGADIPGFSTMPIDELRETVRTLGGKIQAGQEQFDRIHQASGAFEHAALGNPRREDASNLVWFVKSKAAEAAGSPYEKGAMTLPDPENKIRRYLDTEHLSV
jgi:hypothetical protein